MSLQPYLRLIQAFTRGGLSADSFEAEFLDLYLNDPTHWPVDLFDVLDGLFADVDDYVAEPALRVDVIDGISAETLRERAIDAHRTLEALSRHRPAP